MVRLTLSTAFKAMLPVAAALVGCFAATAAADIVEVRVYNLDFSAAPSGQPVTDAIIAPGDTIRWRWAGGVHDTTSVAGQPEQWASPTTGQNGFTFDHTFTTLGVSSYICTVHGIDLGGGNTSGMAGRITVTSLNLGKPVPGTAGANNSLQITGATPGGPVEFYYAFRYGSTNVNNCAGIKLSLSAPTLAGTRTANASGVATLNSFVPAGVAGRTVVLQAVDRVSCQVSTLEQFTFN